MLLEQQEGRNLAVTAIASNFHSSFPRLTERGKGVDLLFSKVAKLKMIDGVWKTTKEESPNQKKVLDQFSVQGQRQS